VSLPEIFAKFVEQTPVPVMIHGVLAHIFDAWTLDTLFNCVAERQHQRELLYSTTLELMVPVVTRMERSLGASIRSRKDLPVLPKAVYEKIAGLEPEVISATLAVTAEETRAIIERMPGQPPPLVPGLRTLVLDGNHLRSVHHRIKPLRGTKLAALPGTCVALLDPRLKLFLRCYLLEDGHASERNVLSATLRDLKANDLLIADRNFAVRWFTEAVEDRGAYFLLRQHLSNFPLRLVGKRRLVGQTPTGTVYEQRACYKTEKGERSVRRITVELFRPTRDKAEKLHLVTNVPRKILAATAVADAYSHRWTIETAFRTLTVDLNCELNSLAYPPAALFGFCVAAMAFNAYSVARAALNSRHGAERMQRELSSYYLANEIRKVWTGMRVAISDQVWIDTFGSMNRQELVDTLLELADRVDLRLYKKAPTRPHPPPVKGASSRARHHHVSVHKLLKEKC
jgi:hypothetical protein